MHDRYHWPLAIAIVLLLTEALLPAASRKRDRTLRGEIPAPRQTLEGTAKRLVPADAAKLLSVWAVALMVSRPALASPADALKDYSRGRYTNALTEYERLIKAQSQRQKPEDPRLHFNAGDAAYRATNYSTALQHYTAALSTPDLQLQAKAYYNRGNVHFRLGQQAQDLDKLEESWQEAIKEYQHAASLNPTDADITFNLAFTQQCVKQIRELRELARKAKEEADAETRLRNYHKALEIMEQLLKTNLAAKPFEEFTKKLKNIDAIANPSQP
jgi:Ca-activated chloride channel family protein